MSSGPALPRPPVWVLAVRLRPLAPAYLSRTPWARHLAALPPLGCDLPLERASLSHRHSIPQAGASCNTPNLWYHFNAPGNGVTGLASSAHGRGRLVPDRSCQDIVFLAGIEDANTATRRVHR